MGVAAAGYLPPLAGALLQEVDRRRGDRATLCGPCAADRAGTTDGSAARQVVRSRHDPRAGAAHPHRRRRGRRRGGRPRAARACGAAPAHQHARARAAAGPAARVGRRAVRLRSAPALPLADIRRHAHFDLLPGTLAAVDAAAHSVDRRRRPHDHLRPAARGRRALARARRCLARSPSPARPTPPARGRGARRDRAARLRAASRLRLGAARLRAGDHGRDRVAQPGPSPRSRSSRPSRHRCGCSASEAGRRDRRAAVPARDRAARRRARRRGAPGRARARRRPAGGRRARRRPAAARRPGVPGLPADADGFIPVDPYGRVPGVPDVFAAGDATTFPLKQGGLATQQADAAAEAIAAELGARGATRSRSGPCCAACCSPAALRSTCARG